MNEALARLAKQLDLAAPANERLRLEFAHACTLRVKHLLEEPAVLEQFATLGQYLEGSLSRARLESAATEAGSPPCQPASRLKLHRPVWSRRSLGNLCRCQRPVRQGRASGRVRRIRLSLWSGRLWCRV